MSTPEEINGIPRPTPEDEEFYRMAYAWTTYSVGTKRKFLACLANPIRLRMEGGLDLSAALASLAVDVVRPAEGPR